MTFFIFIFLILTQRAHKIWFGAFWRQVHILSGNGIWYVLLEFILTTNSHTHYTNKRLSHTALSDLFFFRKNEWMWGCLLGASPVVEYHNATYTIHNVAISFCFLSHHISTDVVEILLSISREIHIARYLDSAGYGMQTECSGISRGLRIEFRGIFFSADPLLDTA